MSAPNDQIYDTYDLRDEAGKPLSTDPFADSIWLDPPGCVVIPGKVDLPGVVRTDAALKAGLYISVVLQGSGESWFNDGSHRFVYSPNLLATFALREDFNMRAESRRDSRVRSVAVVYPVASLRQLGVCDLFDALFAGDQIVFHKAVPASPRIQTLAAEMMWPKVDGAVQRLLLGAQATEILARALSEQAADSGDENLPDAVRVNLNIVKGLIEANLERAWTIAELAEEAGLTRASFLAKFYREFGVSPMDYLRTRRLDVAREALVYGRVSVTQAALGAGYANPANFATAFRRRFGVVPSKLRGLRSRG